MLIVTERGEVMKIADSDTEVGEQLILMQIKLD